MKYGLPFFNALLACFFSVGLFAQTGFIDGKVNSSETGESIPLVTVYLTNPGQKSADFNNVKGAVTDFNGRYKLESKSGTFNLTFSAVGFKSKTESVEVVAGQTIKLNVKLESSVLELNEVIYSENRSPQKIEEATVSVSLVKPELIQARNAISADLVIEQIPGVSIIDAEPQVRGGSGWSSGLGSRVLVLIDDMPILRADAGRPMWSFYPMENTSQIEVVKGASSVLYGSGASNGVINIRTAFPNQKPQTKISLFSGMYSPPASPAASPWESRAFNNMKSGLNVLHSRIIRPKNEKWEMDLVVGGQAIYDQGFKGGEPLKSLTGNFDTNRVNDGEYEHSVRANFNTRFRIKSIEGLSFGLNGNAMIMNESQSFFWQDADSNIFNMAPGSLTNFSNLFFYLDPFITYGGSKGSRHVFRARLFGNVSDGDVGPDTLDPNVQDSRSRTSFAEYQFNKDFSKSTALPFLTKDLSITAGVSFNHTWSTGGVFSGTGTGGSTSEALNAAGYLQLEKKFFKRLTVTGGARWEYFKVNEATDNKPVFRVGANFRASEGTYIRGSWGQGFRFPTIGERYISTTSGGSGFFANPNLRPETSWSAELGVKQLYKMGKKIRGFLDFAGFWQEYTDYVEFAFVGFFNSNLNPTDSLIKGFKFFNTGPARITGLEAIAYLQYQPAKYWSVDFNFGYTYTMPISLDTNYEFGQNIVKANNVFPTTYDTIAISYSNTSVNSGADPGILKYRIQHLINWDVQVGYKKWSAGVTGRYYSTMRVVDQFLFSAGSNFGDLPGYFQRVGDGAWVFDFRLGYDWKWGRIGVIMENIGNTTYSVRPLGVAPPRLTTVQLSFKF